MATKTIKELLQLTGTPEAADVLVITDINQNLTKKITVDDLISYVDSDYIQARQIVGGSGTIDSATVFTLIDSDYIQARQIVGGSGTIDSATVFTLIDSDYIQARVTLEGVGIDSAQSAIIANQRITTVVDSAYVQSRITLDGVGIDSATAISLANSEILTAVDSAYVQARVTSTTSPSVSTQAFTTTENLVAGDTVSLNPDGTISKVAIAVPPPGTAQTLSTLDPKLGNYTLASDYIGGSVNRLIFAFVDTTNSVYVVAASQSGDAFTIGTPALVFTEADTTGGIGIAASDTEFVVTYYKSGFADLNTYARAGTVSGTTITLGTQVEVYSDGGTPETDIAYSPVDNSYLLLAAGANYGGRCSILTVSGTTITVNPTYSIFAGAPSYVRVEYVPEQDIFVSAWRDVFSGPNKINVRAISVSGGTIVTGSTVTILTTEDAIWEVQITVIGSQIVLSYSLDTATTDDIIAYITLNVSGNVISVAQTETTIVTGDRSGYNFGEHNFIYDSDTSTLLFAWDDFSSGTGKLKAKRALINNSVITFGSEFIINNDDQYGIIPHGLYNPSEQRVVLQYYHDTENRTEIISLNNNGVTNRDRFIGIAEENITALSSGNVTITGGINEQVTGLTTGSYYYLTELGSLTATPAGSTQVVGRAIDSDRFFVNIEPLESQSAGVDSASTISLITTTVDSAYVQSRITLDAVGIDSATATSIADSRVITLVDSAYIQSRITLDGVGIDSATASSIITTTVDSAYVQSRITLDGVGIDSATATSIANTQITTTVDSAYVQARVDISAGSVDSASVQAIADDRITTLVDSAYVQSRTTLGGGGIDSSSTVSLITTTVDSAYVQARQIVGGSSYTDGDVAAYLNGNLDTSLLPDTNAAYDLGAAEFKFRHLYLSQNSIKFVDSSNNQFTLGAPGGVLTFNGEAVGGGGGGGGGTTIYDSVSAFPSVGNSTAAYAYASNTNKLYIWTGTGWDRVYTGPDEPLSWLSPPDSTYSIPIGSSQLVSLSAQDPEGFDISYGYVTSPASQTKISFAQDSSQITMTGDSAGSISVKFTATDGVHVISRLTNVTVLPPSVDITFEVDPYLTSSAANTFSYSRASGTLTSGSSNSAPLRSDGKYYFEVDVTGISGTTAVMFGLGLYGVDGGELTTDFKLLYGLNGNIFPPNAGYLGAGFVAGSTTLMFAYDALTREVWFGSNGTWGEDPTSASSYTIGGSSGDNVAIIFGTGTSTSLTFQGTIKLDADLTYSVPTGFLSH